METVGRIFPLFLCFSIFLSPTGALFDDWRWEGKVAVVTGANCEIATMMVTILAELGTKTVALLKDEDKFEGDKSDPHIFTRKCDMAKEEDIIEAFNWIASTVGNVDILINNAEIYYPGDLISGVTAEWKNTLNINVLGAAVASREALKTMMKSNNGHILNINSIASHNNINDAVMGMYIASKFAMTGLTEELQNELAEKSSKIKVTTISRGMVRTNTSLEMESVKMMDPSDMIDAIVYTLNTKPGVIVYDIIIDAFDPTPACKRSHRK